MYTRDDILNTRRVQTLDFASLLEEPMDLVNDVVMPFIRVTVETFTSMVNLPVEVESCEYTEYRIHASGIYATISFVGNLSGSIAISFDTPTGLELFSRFLEEKVTELDEQAADAAGELINIIAGGKSYIQGYSLTMSLPSVMFGESMLISLPRDVPVVKTVFHNPEAGRITLLVGLKEMT